MRKLLATLGIVLFSFAITGCKLKDPNKGRLIPEGQTLRLQIWTSQEKDFVEALGREFIAASKTPGVFVSVIEFESDEELQNYLVQQMAEEEGPDIIFTEGEWIARNTKKLLPITGDESFTPERFRATFVRAAIETMVRDGKIFGVPVAVDTLAVFYNEEHLIDRLANRNTPGRTWNEFKSDVETLTKQNNSFERFLVSGAAIGRTDNLNYGFAILENLMLQMGTKFFTDDAVSAQFATTLGITSDGRRINFGVEALDFFTSFADPRFKNFSWSEFLANPDVPGRDFDAFVEGKVSMVFGFSRDLGRIKELLAKKRKAVGKLISERVIRVSFLPQFGDPRSSSSRKVIANVLAFSVPRTTQNPDIAWRFLKFAARKENLRSFFNAVKLPTARLDLITEQASEPDIGIFVRQAKFARSNLLPIPRTQFQSGFEQLVSEVNAGKTGTEKGLYSLEQKFTDQLQRRLKRESAIKAASKKLQTSVTDEN